MGWSHGWVSLRSLIAELTKGWTNDKSKDDLVVTSTCLAKCFRGNPAFKGTLWSVWEQVFKNRDGTKTKPPERFIRCDLVQVYNREWGYKDLCESMGPVVCNCPEKYLRMVPEVANGDWREKVAEYHTQRRQKAVEKKARKAAA